jgi:hypothetical protein
VQVVLPSGTAQLTAVSAFARAQRERSAVRRPGVRVTARSPAVIVALGVNELTFSC